MIRPFTQLQFRNFDLKSSVRPEGVSQERIRVGIEAIIAREHSASHIHQSETGRGFGTERACHYIKHELLTSACLKRDAFLFAHFFVNAPKTKRRNQWNHGNYAKVGFIELRQVIHVQDQLAAFSMQIKERDFAVPTGRIRRCFYQ